jgi:hypothetical protein
MVNSVCAGGGQPPILLNDEAQRNPSQNNQTPCKDASDYGVVNIFVVPLGVRRFFLTTWQPWCKAEQQGADQ